MKKNDAGDFCLLYIEAHDERTFVFQHIQMQKKPVVMIVSEQTRLFHHPEDFTALKLLKRSLGFPILFVEPPTDRFGQFAARNGFPVYETMDQLSQAASSGQLRQRRSTTGPLSQDSPSQPSRRSQPLPHLAVAEEDIPLQPAIRNTAPLARLAISNPIERYTPPPPREPDDLDLRPPRRSFPRLLMILTSLALAFAVIGSALVFFNKFPNVNTASLTGPSEPVYGHVSFLSSEQLSENSNQGIGDEIMIDLQQLSSPAAGKSYYAWVLGDKNQSEGKTILMGALTIENGKAQILYKGDDQHTNLVSQMSRFLITEEDSSITPIAPTPDIKNWRYYGEFAQQPIQLEGSTKAYSYLDHVRHLLASDPTLDKNELPGGLNTWLYRNSSKIVEWTGSMREQWEESHDISFLRRQTARVLAYLDGMSYVGKDLPAGMASGVTPRLASIGLLQVDGPNQDPASYMTHVVNHMNGLLQISNTEELRKIASGVITSLNNSQYWLTQVQRDAQQLIKLSDQDLQKPDTLNLVNDMIAGSQKAFTGWTDPATGEQRQGINFAHQQMLSMATITIKPYVAGSTSIKDIWQG